MKQSNIELQAGSFRDPSGFVFSRGGKLYRQVNHYYKKDYDQLVKSGLLNELSASGLLVAHKDVTDKMAFASSDGYKVIQPDIIDFISYPYEWSFSQYKDAALTTLEIHRRALEKGMVLKDASAYNIQFQAGRPVFLDTLSFEAYNEGEPWIAYKQFCQHFLAPLALMAYTDVDLSKLMKVYIDGIPLPLASKLLPKKTKRNLRLLTHIHWHAKTQLKHAEDGKKTTAKKIRLSKSAMQGLINNLAATVKALRWNPTGTEWGEYYTFTNYSDRSFDAKKKIIKGYVEKAKPKTAWDVGANNGLFSRIASEQGVPTVAFDIDPIAVEENYRQVKKAGEENILPLVMDLTNPSPSLGWASEERESFVERGPADIVFSLALIHHLAISNNLPLAKLADFFATIGKYLVLEFVPKGDSQVNILLATRKDIFPDYTEDGFEQAFKTRFSIVSKNKVPGSKRTLYLLKRK
jgi:ribosomal protein L11 methylase PrmA